MNEHVKKTIEALDERIRCLAWTRESLTMAFGGLECRVVAPQTPPVVAPPPQPDKPEPVVHPANNGARRSTPYSEASSGGGDAVISTAPKASTPGKQAIDDRLRPALKALDTARAQGLNRLAAIHQKMVDQLELESAALGKAAA